MALKGHCGDLQFPREILIGAKIKARLGKPIILVLPVYASVSEPLV